MTLHCDLIITFCKDTSLELLFGYCSYANLLNLSFAALRWRKKKQAVLKGNATPQMIICISLTNPVLGLIHEGNNVFSHVATMNEESKNSWKFLMNWSHWGPLLTTAKTISKHLLTNSHTNCAVQSKSNLSSRMLSASYVPLWYNDTTENT